MFGQRKLKALIWSATISGFIFSSCQDSVLEGKEMQGNTQGTTYSIIIAESNVNINKSSIDSLLKAFDNSLSSYIPNSVVSKINETTDSLVISDATGYFKECFEISEKVYNVTNGLFDPSVYPLVSGWGFMENMESPLSVKEVDSVLRFVSFERGELYDINFDDPIIVFKKHHPQFKLDFNAIAQGQSVDVVYDYIRSKGHKNFYVEIGGEVRVSGKNKEGRNWRIGVDSPDANSDYREIENVITISDAGLATSGNYRNYYVVDSVKYAHTLDPTTGMPVQHNLLSATVVADNCATADAYATAFMVMGVDNAMEFIEDHPKLALEVYLLYAKSDGTIGRKMSKGFSKYLNK